MSWFPLVMPSCMRPIGTRPLFFYPYIRGSYGLVEQSRFQPDGRIHGQMDPMPAVSTGVVSAGPWRSQIEINYSYDFGIYSDHGGGPPIAGRHGFLSSCPRSFGRSRVSPSLCPRVPEQLKHFSSTVRIL